MDGRRLESAHHLFFESRRPWVRLPLADTWPRTRFSTPDRSVRDCLAAALARCWRLGSGEVGGSAKCFDAGLLLGLVPTGCERLDRGVGTGGFVWPPSSSHRSIALRVERSACSVRAGFFLLEPRDVLPSRPWPSRDEPGRASPAARVPDNRRCGICLGFI